MVDFLELFNGVAKVARPIQTNWIPATSLDQTFQDLSLDSMDTLMVCIYMSELYGIDEETAKTMQPKTIQELCDFLQQHKTMEPQSIEDAVQSIK
jgi:acyl carrier protein